LSIAGLKVEAQQHVRNGGPFEQNCTAYPNCSSTSASFSYFVSIWRSGIRLTFGVHQSSPPKGSFHSGSAIRRDSYHTSSDAFDLVVAVLGLVSFTALGAF
jgi:hypothetical protein